MKQDLMKQKNDKKLRTQSIWTVVSLVVAFLLLAFLFLMSRMYLHKLERQMDPLLSDMEEAALASDYTKLSMHAGKVLGILEDAENTLQLFASHYDIENMMNSAKLLVLVGDAGGDCDTFEYLDKITNIRSWICFFRENNRLTHGIVF